MTTKIMSTTQTFSLSVLVIAVLVGSCSGLSCNDCASKDDPKCLDRHWPNDDQYYNDCDDRQTHCAKFKTVVFLQDSGFITGKERVVEVVSRMCIRQDAFKGRDYCAVEEIDSGFRFFCLCTTDNCNSGHSVLPSMLFVSIAAIITSWFLRQI